MSERVKPSESFPAPAPSSQPLSSLSHLMANSSLPRLKVRCKTCGKTFSGGGAESKFQRHYQKHHSQEAIDRAAVSASQNSSKNGNDVVEWVKRDKAKLGSEVMGKVGGVASTSKSSSTTSTSRSLGGAIGTPQLSFSIPAISRAPPATSTKASNPLPLKSIPSHVKPTFDVRP